VARDRRGGERHQKCCTDREHAENSYDPSVTRQSDPLYLIETSSPVGYR
jgi:hypothetical protein